MPRWSNEMIVRYARESTDAQSLDAQQAALKEAGAERVFAKKQSGLRGAQRSPQWLGQPRDVGRNPARLVAPGPPCRSTSQTRLTISRCGSPPYGDHRLAHTSKRMLPSTIDTRPGQFAFSVNPAPGLRGSRVSRGTPEDVRFVASLSRPRQIG